MRDGFDMWAPHDGSMSTNDQHAMFIGSSWDVFWTQVIPEAKFNGLKIAFPSELDNT